MPDSPVTHIQPPRLTWPQVRDRAEEFRNAHVIPADLLPVPIVEIVELDLRLSPIPVFHLLEEIDIDGFLTKDLKGICIDQDIYENHRKENRLRFTFAHEVGHFVLHRKEIQMCRFRSLDDWKRFREDFEEDDLMWFEQQAYEFAGRLLVPRESLVTEVRRLASKITDYRKRGGNDAEQITQAISRSICRTFAVSAEVIARRIKSERISL